MDQWKRMSESIDGEVMVCWAALAFFAVIALLFIV